MAAKKLELDKQHRYPWAVIETAVHLYLGEGFNYRAVSEKMSELGVVVSHKTVYEWVQKFSDHVKKTAHKRPVRYSMEESDVTCNGDDFIQYRAMDSRKKTLCVYLTKNRNMLGAKRAFKNFLENSAN